MALTIQSSFVIAAPPATAWTILTDIERAAPCFPGAQLLGRNDDGSWRASFGVKLGPMNFSFAGKFHLDDVDAASSRVVVKAQGSDTKGRGGAKADVNMRLQPEGAGTRAEIISSVDLSGAVAQFGRGAGMIEALSRQLMDQFAANLQQSIGEMPKTEPDSHGPAQAGSLALPSAASPPAVASLDAGSLMWRALAASVKGWFARLIGRRS